MKYSYKIVGLDCANCAKKIEETLNKEKGFSNVVVNFATSKVSYETNLSNSFQRVNEIIDKVEPGAKLLKEEKQEQEYSIFWLILAVIFGLIGVKGTFKWSKLLLYVSYVLLLYRPFLKAFKMFYKSKTINENFLIVLSCVGALLVGSEMEGMMVAALYLLGKILEEKAINKTRNSIHDLLTIKQDYANVKEGEKLKKIPVESVKIGDILCIKKGEKVPVDGIIQGEGTFDTSALTGEAEPILCKKGEKVLSGFMNVGELVSIKVSSLFKDSTVAKILELVENASDAKAPVETTVSKFSKIYTPVILLLAILVALFLPIIAPVTYGESLYRALTFLVISCPCAIAISVPLSYFTGIGVSSRNGILVKGSNYLDNLRNIKKIIFDKTGTLTTGTFEVLKIDVLDKNYTKEEVISILRMGESFSNHPIAKSIMKLSDQEVDNSKVLNYQELEGRGISFELASHLIKIGNKELCSPTCKKDASIHLNIDSSHVASIYIDDGIKENAKEVLEKLHHMGINSYLFTGDKEEVATFIGKKLEIDKVYANMLPNDKYEQYEVLEREGYITAFVGDGINDSPVLKRANIGISMGGVGSDVAIAASDVVIMNDDLAKIPLGIAISKYTNFIIKENLIFALSLKFLILLLSIFGLSTMWFAVFADTGLTVLTILNSLRILFKFKNKNNKGS